VNLQLWQLKNGANRPLPQCSNAVDLKPIKVKRFGE
jgi:hypothetical protein